MDSAINTARSQRSPAERPPKVLITKIGLDGHDRGSRLVASYLRDAGMEVVYTGPWQAIDHVVALAVEEDIELIGLSSLATDHMLVPQLIEALAAAGLGEVPVVVGGIVPDEDERLLCDAGVARIYHPGSGGHEIVEGIRGLIEAARDAAFAPTTES
ncbi:MAG: cobalamin B12-binding domain-containing protein [Alphaproteobacteria bacterium]|nr:cobalamin B12-binding domain-containing protein [Alphaproteobacteria bacterium]